MTDTDTAAGRVAAALNARDARYDKHNVIDSYYEYVSPEEAVLRELRKSDLRTVLAEHAAMTAELERVRGATDPCTSHSGSDWAEHPDVVCELAAEHIWHRNGTRRWTP